MRSVGPRSVSISSQTTLCGSSDACDTAANLTSGAGIFIVTMLLFDPCDAEWYITAKIQVRFVHPASKQRYKSRPHRESRVVTGEVDCELGGDTVECTKNDAIVR